jgi:VWFA-related protein
MDNKKVSLPWIAGGLVAVVLLAAASSPGQTARPTVAPDDVVRVNTNLVQTDIMVFDKQGRFVSGIRPDQFTVTVDGQSQTLSFFEQVTAGSNREQSQISSIKRSSISAKANAAFAPIARGRLLFFFVDDLHLSPESLNRARKALSEFLDSRMGDDDQIAIVSSSGKVGFLQQLTDNQTVLRTAIERLTYHRETEAYAGKTRISEYAATQIADNRDKALFAYLLDSVKMEQQMGPGSRHGDHRIAAAYSALPMLENRISQINEQSKLAANYTLESLQGLLEAATGLPGRKLVFFLSDGFPFSPKNTQNYDLLKRVTNVAAHSGAVFYSIDVRGTYLGGMVDASSNDMPDYSSRLAGMSANEAVATREVMNILASDTGGRMIINSNRIDEDIDRAVDETGEYYLLAWTLAPELLVNAKLRVKVSVNGRPDLKVRMRGDKTIAAVAAPSEVASIERRAKPQTPPDPQAELLAALGTNYRHRQIPLHLSAGYLVDGSDGALLRVSMQIDRNSLTADPRTNGPQPSLLEVAGAAVDDRGVIVSFKQKIAVNGASAGPTDPVVWNQQLKVPAGLYQVRVAVVEAATGRTGSANQWIEVAAPDAGKLALSSIFLGERNAKGESKQVGSRPAPVIVDVDHQFSRGSVLRFQVYVYNAVRTAAQPPDVWLGAQVSHHGRTVLTVAPSQLPPIDGPALPFWTEIGLDQLPPGRYTLQLNATDRRAGTSASQRIKFTVE